MNDRLTYRQTAIFLEKSFQSIVYLAKKGHLGEITHCDSGNCNLISKENIMKYLEKQEQKKTKTLDELRKKEKSIL
jgi:hypothetical protein